MFETDYFAQKVQPLLEWLAEYGADPEGGVTRLLYSKSWYEAQQALSHRMKNDLLDVYFDDVGNLFGILEGTEIGKVILTGSHVDTVRDGGKYDGAYGVIAGIIALQYLKETFGPPKRSLAVVSFCEEEGSRFPLTFWGSGSVTGDRTMEDIVELQDAEQISFREAMESYGFGLGQFRSPLRTDISAFIELHIEQGSILERERKSIGIVEQIVGQKRYKVEVCGEANHAGTTPMAGRKDAIVCSARMITRIQELAVEQGAPLVATVGTIQVEPNTANVIPGKAVFTIDVRHPEQADLDRFCQELLLELDAISNDIGLVCDCSLWTEARPVPMDSVLTGVIEDVCSKRQLQYRRMPSGAGHDAQILGTKFPAALLFVPSHKGISHSPLEYTSPEHLAAGAAVLAEVLYNLGYGGQADETI